jgi:uncharacterized protein (TIGR00730 family)
MNVCIFCGSSAGSDRTYLHAARRTGRILAEQDIGIVYGGGRVGLMGAVADAAVAYGGRVIGVIPRALVEAELAHRDLSGLHVVETMHERKARMADLADAFVALPGGAGTLEEMFEQWTWAQLGIHEKACGFLNVKGYFDPLQLMIDKMAVEGFIRRDHANMLAFSNDIEVILEVFSTYAPPPRKWMPISETVQP